MRGVLSTCNYVCIAASMWMCHDIVGSRSILVSIVAWGGVSIGVPGLTAPWSCGCGMACIGASETVGGLSCALRLRAVEVGDATGRDTLSSASLEGYRAVGSSDRMSKP